MLQNKPSVMRVEILRDGTHILSGFDRNSCAAYMAPLMSVHNAKECECFENPDGTFSIRLMVMVQFAPVQYPECDPAEFDCPETSHMEDDVVAPVSLREIMEEQTADELWKNSEQAKKLTDEEREIISERTGPAKPPQSSGGSSICSAQSGGLPSLSERYAHWKPAFANVQVLVKK